MRRSVVGRHPVVGVILAAGLGGGGDSRPSGVRARSGGGVVGGGGVRVARPVMSVTREGEYRVALPLAGGMQTIWFTGDTLLVHRAEETRQGGVVLRVTFEEYQDGFPRSLDVAGEGDRSARLTYDA